MKKLSAHSLKILAIHAYNQSGFDEKTKALTELHRRGLWLNDHEVKLGLLDEVEKQTNQFHKDKALAL